MPLIRPQDGTWDKGYKYTFPYPKEEHQARVMCLDPQALAYEWIKGYAEQYNFTADKFITVALSRIKDFDEHGERGWGGNTVTGGSEMEGESTDPLFWEKLSIFLGEGINIHAQTNFFTCAC